MSLRNFIFALFIITLIGINFSCNLINPVQPIPSYIRINSISLTAAGHPISQYGSISSKITDAWVYIDGHPIGAFELPAKFPVLWTGTHSVTIYPGIKVNGIAETRAIYPFYSSFVSNVNLVSDSIITIDPKTITYNTVPEWKEDFEDAGVSLSTDTIYSNAYLKKTNDVTKVFEGNYSGIVDMDASHNLFRCKTINSYSLPLADSPVFLEMNYKTNEEMLVGLYATNGSETERLEVLYINKTDTWNKIYINLKTAISNTSLLSPTFQVFIEVQKSSDVSNPEILLDNLKLIY